ncbi:MAG: hypothetical protein NC111_00605 [Bacteroides sp.]|nr:hypothetical protein [Bacteroides sp.]MCM1414152.1 hypothetical protein [Bacteroides sp.]MCM1471018.1 hypothetical protein [Bacteroides sp.]
MKKCLMAIFFSLVATISMLAVPTGNYYSRDTLYASVAGDGKTIYVYDRAGNLKHNLQVIQENPDGTFTVKDQITGITRSDNSYWYENGHLYMNICWLARTVERK